MKYFLYCRKSTEEKDRQLLSIECQKDEIYKRFPGLEIVEVFEEAKSAFKPYNRPVFSEMLQRIQNGEADGIAAWDPSRLSRNPIDGSMIIHFLDTGDIKDLKFGSYHFDNSPEGKMMLSFALSQSKYHSDKLSKDVTRGMRKKCEIGYRPCRAPIGYMSDYSGLKGQKKILMDPERFDLVQRMWEMLLTGTYTVPEIWKVALNEWHFQTRQSRNNPGRKLALSLLYKMFTNPFYYGEFQWGGEWYQGDHQPMISKEEFDRAQIILGRKGKPRPQKHRFPYTGAIKCGECGCSVTAEHKLKRLKKTRETKTYTYYHCTKKKTGYKCGQRSITDKNLEEQIAEVLGKIEIPENLLKCTLHYLREMHDKESGDRDNIEKRLRGSFADCSRRIDNLLQLFICPENSDKSLLNEEEFKEQKRTLLNEKESIMSKIQDCSRRQNDWLSLSEETFNFATHARAKFESGTLDEKKQIFQHLGQNFILKDQKLAIELKKPFVAIKNSMEELRERNIGFSPKITLKIDLSKPNSSELAKIWSG